MINKNGVLLKFLCNCCKKVLPFFSFLPDSVLISFKLILVKFKLNYSNSSNIDALDNKNAVLDKLDNIDSYDESTNEEK